MQSSSNERRNKMNNYYLNNNKQSIYAGGNYEVHKQECDYCYPSADNFEKLGIFSNEMEAVYFAKITHQDKAQKIDGCKYCCPNAHKN